MMQKIAIGASTLATFAGCIAIVMWVFHHAAIWLLSGLLAAMLLWVCYIIGDIVLKIAAARPASG